VRATFIEDAGGGVSDANDHILKAIHHWVWSGFYDRQAVIDLVDLNVEAGMDRDAIVAAARNEFRRKAVVEAGWPETTDPDRLNEAFAALNSQGICALQNAGWDQSDGYQDVLRTSAARAGEYRGYCFFHSQDLERAVAGQGLFLVFGLIETGKGEVEIGRTIRRALVNRGLTVDWDEKPETRILLPNLDWKRRLS
jgi:hypothetical protein